MKITFKGSPLTLVGRSLSIGKPAPDCTVIAQDMSPVRLSVFKGKILVVSSFPSLDTPVCDLQVKEFNKRAKGLSAEVVILGISKDLPFAQRRFCEQNDIVREQVLSDYRSSSFGINYGLLIKELNLLARAALIVDPEGYVRYIQIVPEVTSPLDYDAVLAAVADVVKRPSLGKAAPEPAPRCKACEGEVPPLPKEKIERLMAEHRGWQLADDGKKLLKEVRFKDFKEALYYVDMLGGIAEDQGHHPDLEIRYNKVTVTLTTHAAHGLTQNDFTMARIIDELNV